MNKLVNTIKKAAVSAKRPDDTPYKSLPIIEVQKIATAFEISGRYVEIEALEMDIIPERYVRNMNTFSLSDQIKLLQSNCCIIGLGGLGGGVVEILSRIGVGQLTLIDGDVFEDHNLNRQFLSTPKLIGTSKAEAAADRVRRINSSVVVTNHNEFLTDQNGSDFLSGSDVVIDCLDSINTRFTLETFTRKLRIPLVSAAIAGLSGQLTTIFPEDQGLRLIYGEPQDLQVFKGAETSLGTLPPAVTLLSSLECSEAIKILLKKGQLLRDRLLVVDLADCSFEVLSLI